MPPWEVRIQRTLEQGKNAFLSSVGCINPCTRLPTPDERIDCRGSRARVIALINDIAAFLGRLPRLGDRPLPNAFAVILNGPRFRGLGLVAPDAGGGRQGARNAPMSPP